MQTRAVEAATSAAADLSTCCQSQSLQTHVAISKKVGPLAELSGGDGDPGALRLLGALWSGG